ncbi:hypothetical protein CVV68_01165 [Arthrobacter livingstonensis]|uniref:Relaxase n=1 Tax=Arthrobacter livingstonensis TaxID=670078 RepID=A0A2V5LE24_9MICC|nr:relaxase/mobilization nuclease domain-containing protein [Arthrobacter livingstonensis]PYI69748.1 hypothetical protein CVV68_01165 [Arthrobacter livingstonensis]
MPVEYAGTTTVASRLLRYTVKPKPGQTAKDRVLHIAGQNCRPGTAEREFAATRRRHGTQGAKRKSPATYALPELGEAATHVRRTRPNGRRYWAVAKSGEAATHVRHEGEVVRQSEARHLITSFGLDEVNPEDPEQVAKAFEYVVARHANLYPGEQATFVGQAEGKGGNFHVHATRNATLYQDMEVDGKLYRAGRKLAGDLTDIDKMRERSDRFLAEHGREYDLVPQRLPSVAERKKEQRNQRDRRMAAEGALSNQDQIRQAFVAAMDDPRAVDLDTWKSVMADHGVTVTEPGWRRGKSPKVLRLSYQLSGMGTPVRAKTLGEHYEHASALGQLSAKAHGRPREHRPEFVKAGVPRPVAQSTGEELAAAYEAMARMAREERGLRTAETELYRWIAARGHDKGVGFGDILDRLPESHDSRMRVMQLWNRLADASRAQSETLTDNMEERWLGTPSVGPTAAAVGPHQLESAVAEPAQKALDSELLDLLIVDEALVQYGIYRADSAAMHRAGIEPREISDARNFWESLSSDAQRMRYRERKKASQASLQAEEVTSAPEDKNEMQSSQRLTRALLEDSSVEEGHSLHTGRPVRTRGARQQVDEENPHAAAARRERMRRDSLRRWVLQGDDESPNNEDDLEFGD